MPPRDGTFLEQLVQGLITRVDSYHDSMNNKLDDKVESLEKTMCEELRLLRKDITDRSQ